MVLEEDVALLQCQKHRVYIFIIIMNNEPVREVEVIKFVVLTVTNWLVRNVQTLLHSVTVQTNLQLSKGLKLGTLEKKCCFRNTFLANQDKL